MRRREAGVEAAQEVLRLTLLRTGRPGDHDRVERRFREPELLLHEQRCEAVEHRRLTALDELSRDRVAEPRPPVLARELARVGVAAQRLVDGLGIERHAERAHPHHPAARVRDRPPDRPREPLVDGPDEHHADLRPREPAPHEARVGRVREGVERVAAPRGALGGRLRRVAIGLELVDPGFEVLALGVVHEAATGEAHADEDPDHEGDEDRGERGNVIAQVEHRRECRRALPPVGPLSGPGPRPAVRCRRR